MVQAKDPNGSEVEDFLIFLIYFNASNQGSPGAGPFWTLRPILNKLVLKQIGKGQLCNATYQLLSI